MSLKDYSTRFPEIAKSLEEISGLLDAIAAVQECDLSDIKTLKELHKRAFRLFDFTVINLKQPALDHPTKDFICDHLGPMILYKTTKKLFSKYVASKQARKATNATTTLAITTLNTVLACLQNFADNHAGFRLACGETGMIEFYLQMCERVIADRTDPRTREVGALGESSREVVERSTNVLYNISREQGNSSHFAACNAPARLQRFSKLPQGRVGVEIPVLSLLCLAYLVDENNNHLINADDSLIEFLVRLLSKAVTSEERVCDGFTTVELADGLIHVAENDANKAVIGRQGAVRLLLLMIRSSTDEREQLSATNALWKLAFAPGNKEIIQTCGGIALLESLHDRQSLELRKAAAGALWEISGKQERKTGVLANENESSGHVMISYQWNSQVTVVELKKRLESMGYQVWLDLDEMGGSTLEAMARAVEGASTVLLCLSQKYKASPNCRSEAEYAYQCQKHIIPLMMEENYKPDGWLGIILASKLWYKFWSKGSFNASVAQLQKELAGKGRQAEQIGPPTYTDQVDSKPPASPPCQANFNAQSEQAEVRAWSVRDVKQWLRQINLYEICEEAVPYLSGQTLIDLHELRKEYPEYFYRSLEKDLGLQNVFNVLRFRNELSKLLD